MEISAVHIPTVITIVTTLATLITAVATLYTVREIKKQRESTYYPELYLSNLHFYVYPQKFKEAFLPFNFSSEEIKDPEIISRQNLGISIHNVGFGAAKAIDIEWKVDLNAIFSLIQQANKSGFFHTHFERGILQISAPKIDYQMVDMVSSQMRKHTINYILPSAIDKTATLVSVPQAYVRLYIIYLCCVVDYYSPKSTNKESVKSYKSLKDFPEIELKLSYKDLHGKSHTKSFAINIDFHMMTNPQDIKDETQHLGQHTLITREKLESQNLATGVKDGVEFASKLFRFLPLR